MATIEIDINSYLSEDEKREIVIDVFRTQVKNELFKSQDGTIQSDSEIQRVIGNITGQIVMNEVQKYIPDYKKFIEENTLKSIQKADFSYQVFKKKDAWDKEESLAITYMREVITKSKNDFQEKIRETVLAYDPTDDIKEAISDQFGEMADTIYKLSELFHKK